VETTGFGTSCGSTRRAPLSRVRQIIERFRRVNYGTLEIEITVDDPKTFTKPWTIKLNQRLMPDTDLIEFVCSENNKSLGTWWVIRTTCRM